MEIRSFNNPFSALEPARAMLPPSNKTKIDRVSIEASQVLSDRKEGKKEITHRIPQNSLADSRSLLERKRGQDQLSSEDFNPNPTEEEMPYFKKWIEEEKYKEEKVTSREPDTLEGIFTNEEVEKIMELTGQVILPGASLEPKGNATLSDVVDFDNLGDEFNDLFEPKGRPVRSCEDVEAAFEFNATSNYFAKLYQDPNNWGAQQLKKIFKDRSEEDYSEDRERVLQGLFYPSNKEPQRQPNSFNSDCS